MGWQERCAALEVLLGNHEASMLAALSGEPRWLDAWLGFGGRETLISYGVPAGLLDIGTPGEIAEAMLHHIPDAHRRWLDGLPLSLSSGDYFFAHAGVRPGVALDAQDPEDLLWIRGDFLSSRADLGAVVIHGHSVRPQVEEKPNRIGIDTGAYATGKLTAIGLEGTERWFLQT